MTLAHFRSGGGTGRYRRLGSSRSTGTRMMDAYRNNYAEPVDRDDMSIGSLWRVIALMVAAVLAALLTGGLTALMVMQ